jgi:hypothetical protein
LGAGGTYIGNLVNISTASVYVRSWCGCNGSYTVRTQMGRDWPTWNISLSLSLSIVSSFILPPSDFLSLMLSKLQTSVRSRTFSRTILNATSTSPPCLLLYMQVQQNSQGPCKKGEVSLKCWCAMVGEHALERKVDAVSPLCL